MRLPILLGIYAAAALTFPSSSIAAEKIYPQYTKANDKARCQYREEKGGTAGPDSCEFVCDGPVAEVKTKLLSCYDYEHLFFRIDGNWYSTWNAMTQVGGFSGLANKNGIIEWVFSTEKAPTREALQGLIVRFAGTGEDNQSRNALSVFSLHKGDICWKGNYADNESARQALFTAACKEKLAPVTE